MSGLEDDVLGGCLRDVARLTSGAKVESGADGTVWLMPDGAQAVMWKSERDFLFGSGNYSSVFDFAATFRNVYPTPGDSGDIAGYCRFARLNEWMQALLGCSSAQQLRLALDCVE